MRSARKSTEIFPKYTFEKWIDSRKFYQLPLWGNLEFAKKSLTQPSEKFNGKKKNEKIARLYAQFVGKALRFSIMNAEFFLYEFENIRFLIVGRRPIIKRGDDLYYLFYWRIIYFFTMY